MPGVHEKAKAVYYRAKEHKSVTERDLRSFRMLVVETFHIQQFLDQGDTDALEHVLPVAWFTIQDLVGNYQHLEGVGNLCTEIFHLTENYAEEYI